MIRDIEIRNFRCFDSFKMSDLARINIITGKNNIGKTSLLEALFLHLGHHNPMLMPQIDTWRGVKKFALDPQVFARWLFHNREDSKAITITCITRENKRTDLRLSLVRPDVRTLNQIPLDNASQSHLVPNGLGEDRSVKLVFEYMVDGQKMETAEAWIEGDKIKFSRGKQYGPNCLFITSKAGSSNDNADRFSKLKEVRREHEVVDVAKAIDPRLKDLAILSEGGESVIAGDLGFERLVPVAYMGEGMNKILTVILGILSYPGGIILIDEVENGFHYSILSDIWKIISKASRQGNTQVIATTHSYECLKAASTAFAELEETDFCVQRIEKNNGAFAAIRLDKEDLDTVLSANLEIR